MQPWPEYDLELAFCTKRTVRADEIDAYGHVNNAVYLAWMDACAWAHAETIGFGIDRALSEGRGLAVRSVQLNYVGPARLGDDVTVATWITANDERLSGARRFDVRVADSVLVRGAIDYVMLDLATLKPARMPQRYRALEAVPPL